MKTRIMIVDDSVSLLQSLSIILKKAGYEVIETSNGVDAISKLNGSPLDMFFLDLNMPKMDGFELTKKIREHQKYRFVPIIILTTEIQTSKKEEGRSLGVTGWMTKPFTSSQILEVVRKATGIK